MEKHEQPAILQPLIERYGARKVHQTWLQVIGSPATWGPTTHEVLQVTQFLDSQSKGT